MDPDTDVCQTEQPQISYSFDFTAEQSTGRAIQSPNLLGREGTTLYVTFNGYLKKSKRPVPSMVSSGKQLLTINM